MSSPRSFLSLLAIVALPSALAAQAGRAPACAPDNAGWKLPAGFCAVLVAESLAVPRHLAVAPNGDVFFAARGTRTSGGGGVWVLRDTTGDGKADVVRKFFEGPGGSGIALAADAVYFAADAFIVRLPWKSGELAPTGPADTVAKDLPVGGHAAKGIALSNGNLFVSFGSLSNSCLPQGVDRRTAAPGPDPCTELEQRAGIWRFDPKRTGQTPADAKRWATGLRNAMAVSVQPGTGTLYAAVHGRDVLTEQWQWPAEEGRENPAEVVYELPDGANGGWPYCYFDSRQKTKELNPEYSGDMTKACNREMATPALSFPGHWAPNATVFYDGRMFPASYRGGMFVAFHGSWNRGNTPEAQEGFRVVFAPFRDGKPAGQWESFATPAGAHNSIRPSGLAVGPDGSLYIGADAQGKVWRVIYRRN